MTPPESTRIRGVCCRGFVHSSHGRRCEGEPFRRGGEGGRARPPVWDASARRTEPEMTERATARQHSAVRSDGPAPSLRSPSRAAGVFDLHATAGNAAVTAMLGLLPRLDERAQFRAVGVVPPLRARME